MLLRNALLALLVMAEVTASAQTMKLSAKSAELSGPTLHLVQDKTQTPRRYLTGFTHDSDFAIFHLYAHDSGAYKIFCTCRVTGRKDFELTVNAEGISATINAGEASGFALQYLGTADLVRGHNTITVHKGWGGFDLASLVLHAAEAAPAITPLKYAASDPAAAVEARTLLRTLQSGYGKSTLLGVYTDEDAKYLQNVTGRTPALMGGDLMRYSPGFLRHSSDTWSEVERLFAAHQHGQIVTLSWHWASPLGAKDTADEPWFRSFYTKATTFDLNVALNDPQSPERIALLSDIHQIAIQLRRLQDAGVPILWRPLHEAEDTDFWWGAKGAQSFQVLWRLLYRQLTEVEGIHNLLWVFTSRGDMSWYPGDEYVDVISIDGYPQDIHDNQSAIWTRLQQQFAGHRLLAISEFGGVPDVPRMQQLGEWWSYAVSWSDPLGPRKNNPADLKRIVLSSGDGTLPTPAQTPYETDRPIKLPVR